MKEKKETKKEKAKKILCENSSYREVKLNKPNTKEYTMKTKQNKMIQTTWAETKKGDLIYIEFNRFTAIPEGPFVVANPNYQTAHPVGCASFIKEVAGKRIFKSES